MVGAIIHESAPTAATRRAWVADWNISAPHHPPQRVIALQKRARTQLLSVCSWHLAAGPRDRYHGSFWGLEPTSKPIVGSDSDDPERTSHRVDFGETLWLPFRRGTSIWNH
jgi:hypothetical protein